MDRRWKIPLILGVAALLVVCCICLAVAFSATLFWFLQPEYSSPLIGRLAPTDTPVVIRPAPTSVYPLPTGMVTENPPQESEDNKEEGLPLPAIPAYLPDPATQTLQTLREARVASSDPFDLARRLRGKADISPTLEPPLSPPQPGDQHPFWITDTDTNENFQVQAILAYVSANTYIWIETGLSYDLEELASLAETFDHQIYTTTREFFGSEWSPGVDGDPLLYILYVSGLGRSVVGYFSSRDVYPPDIQDFSNGHDMFVLNADSLDLGEEYTSGVLAHEFQHMIHWFVDRDESSWMNEGFSDLAMFLNGYGIGGHDHAYARDPDLQLNDWPNNFSQTAPHYGASFLFLNYFLGRFGEGAAKALAASPLNDLWSIDQVLQETGASDLLSGQPLNADDVFIDWIVTSYLQDEQVGDGRYAYRRYPDAPQPSTTETLHTCDRGIHTRDVRQYGADYISIQCRGDFRLSFEGSIQVGVLPADPHSGAYAFWSNKGDESDMTLTRAFDFTAHSGPLSLSFWTWYDLEDHYDYLYLEASLDRETWQILQTPSGTAENPTGASYGWAYNGLSGGGPHWIHEQVDLSQFAGQKVWIRFEYITDAAVNGEGFLLDDISLPEIGYFSDFEQDDGGWQAEGFVRIQNKLPQTFRLALITTGAGTRVEPIALSADNSAEIPLNLGAEVREAILVVTGTTRYTRRPAAYRFLFNP